MPCLRFISAKHDGLTFFAWQADDELAVWPMFMESGPDTVDSVGCSASLVTSALYLAQNPSPTKEVSDCDQVQRVEIVK